MKLTINIIKAYKPWRIEPFVAKKSIRAVVKEVLCAYHNKPIAKEIELTALLTHSAEMQRLNMEFRGKNKPTNVLSFPDAELDSNTLLEFKCTEDYIYLGDLAFGYEVVKNEAEMQGKALEHHFVHLLVHGLLHLLGFDHEDETEAEEMEALEVKILSKLSIPSPY